MRKKLIWIPFIFCIFLLSGCGTTEETKEPSKKMICESKATQGNVKMDLHYEVSYYKENVQKVETKEILTSNSTETLEGYQKTIQNIYKNYDGIDYYNYDIQLEGNTLTSTVSIDYEKVDTNKLLSVDSSTEQLIKNGKVKLEDIKKVYESVGATCTME